MSNEDGAITLDVVVETVDAAESIDDLIARTTDLVGALRRVRDSLSSIKSAARSASNAFKDSTSATLKAMREAPFRITSALSSAATALASPTRRFSHSLGVWKPLPGRRVLALRKAAPPLPVALSIRLKRPFRLRLIKRPSSLKSANSDIGRPKRPTFGSARRRLLKAGWWQILVKPRPTSSINS
jgi:hypothetical protein